MKKGTFILALASLAASAVAKMKRANDNFKLYAYGSGIGGLSLQYSQGGYGWSFPSGPTDKTGLVYVIQGDQAISGYAPVNCTSVLSQEREKGLIF